MALSYNTLYLTLVNFKEKRMPNIQQFKSLKIENWLIGFLFLLVLTLPSIEVLKQIAIFMIIVLGVVLIIKNKVFIEKDLAFYSLIGLVVTSIISSFFAFDQYTALKGCKDILRLAFTFIILRAIVFDQNTFERLIKLVIIGFIITLIYGYYEYLNGIENHLKINSVGHVNHSSIYILQIFVMASVTLIMMIKELSVQYKILYGLLFIVTLISIYITNSRATMFMALGIVVLLCLYRIVIFKKRIEAIYILVGTFLIVGILLLMNDTILYKFQRGFSDSARFDLWLASVYGWLDYNILFGIGVGNSSYINPKDYLSSTIFTTISHPHNTYISYLLERGIIGLGLYLIFMFYILYILVKRLQIDKKNKFILIAILLWILNFIISFGNTVFHHENAQLMIIFWALALNSNLKEKILR